MEIADTFVKLRATLALDYECVFFVDIETSNYSMHVFRGKHRSLNLTDTSNFWMDSAVNLETAVHPDDKDTFAKCINRVSLIKAVRDGHVFEYKYRIMVNGFPVWCQMKAVLYPMNGREYLVIGVNNIDKQERERLALEKKASKSETYAMIAKALASRFDTLYMVDLKTDHFVQYKAERVFSELGISQEGDDFFNVLKEDSLKVVFKDDIALVNDALSRNVLLKELDEYGAFTLTYRLNSSNGPVYMKLIAAYIDKEHLAISVTNVDMQIRREQELKTQVLKNEVYGQLVMALAERYDALYMVDLETGHFAQYKTERRFSELSITREGDDFFDQLQKDALLVVYKDDLSLVQASLTRDVLLKEMDENGSFSLTYRLNMPSGPEHVNLVAVYADKKHLVISVTNVEVHIRREQKIREEANLAYEKSRRDELTGIKNRNAYSDFERNLNAQIASGISSEFAIAVCDVNGLKDVNDTLGHKAGDEYIKSASRLVCETFKHSPVFRIGGDEFVAILRGSDFENREALEKCFVEAVERNIKENKVVVACGISVYDCITDKNVASVFNRADAQMYQNKVSLKGFRG